jgi:thiol:disulfide interchange protein
MKHLGTLIGITLIIVFVGAMVTLNNKVTPIEKPDKIIETEKLGQYVEYSKSRLENAKEEFIVLFFHANWCPTCKAFEAKVLSEEIPDNIKILKVDFDTNSELRKKYNILTQTSFVLVGNEGTLRKRWV